MCLENPGLSTDIPSFSLIIQGFQLDIPRFSTRYSKIFDLLHINFGDRCLENPGLLTDIPSFSPKIQDFQLDIPRFLIYCTFGESQKSLIIGWKSWNINRESWNSKHILIILEYRPKILEYRR